MAELLSRNWGWIVLRGVVAVLFGLLVLLSTATSLEILVYLFGAYALVDGAAMMVSALADRRESPMSAELVLGGLFAIAIAAVAFVWPHAMGGVLLGLIAAWAFLTGVAQIVAAIRLRAVIPDEWWLVLAGAASVVFAAIAITLPRTGALALAICIGVYALVEGVMLVVVGLELRSWGRRLRSAATPQPA